MSIATVLVAVLVVAFVASLTYLAIQVREARAQEARASWLTSPWGQTQSLSAQAEDLWKTTFQIVYQKTGNLVVACQHADATAQPYFKAAHAAEELARKASSSTVRKDTEGRLKG